MFAGVERKIFGSGISFFLVVFYLEVRELKHKTESLERQLNTHIEMVDRKSSCHAENIEDETTTKPQEKAKEEDNTAAQLGVAASLLSIGGAW